MIIKIKEQDNFEILTKLLNDSFITVANEYGITRENCPFHNAFINSETLKSKLTENRDLYSCVKKGDW